MSFTRQRLQSVREEIDKLKAEDEDFEATWKRQQAEKREKRDRENALTWLRRILFPYFEEIASQRNISVVDAARQMVQAKTRIDLLLKEYWNSPEAQGLIDSTAGRIMLAAAGELLAEDDEVTAKQARWLLHNVLPGDYTGKEIHDAFITDEQLWIDSIVGLKHLFAGKSQRF